MWRPKAFFVLALTLVLSVNAHSQQSKVRDVGEAEQRLFGDVYVQGGFTLYCNAWFGAEIRRNNVLVKPTGIELGHVYAPIWMKVITPCTQSMTVEQCRDASREFRLMEADLHNIYPVLTFVAATRGDRVFTEIPGERTSFEACAVEYDEKAGTFEPTPGAKGNVARAIMYMHSTYNLPVAKRYQRTLMDWHRKDPVSQEERIRNDRIARVQGTRNPFVDSPTLANKLGWGRGSKK